jgi:hypothetical protein
MHTALCNKPEKAQTSALPSIPNSLSEELVLIVEPFLLPYLISYPHRIEVISVPDDAANIPARTLTSASNDNTFAEDMNELRPRVATTLNSFNHRHNFLPSTWEGKKKILLQVTLLRSQSLSN